MCPTSSSRHVPYETMIGIQGATQGRWREEEGGGDTLSVYCQALLKVGKAYAIIFRLLRNFSEQSHTLCIKLTNNKHARLDWSYMYVRTYVRVHMCVYSSFSDSYQVWCNLKSSSSSSSSSPVFLSKSSKPHAPLPLLSPMLCLSAFICVYRERCHIHRCCGGNRTTHSILAWEHILLALGLKLESRLRCLENIYGAEFTET